jgi:hypothetical protein
VAEVVGHLAEAVGCAVREEEDGGAAHADFYRRWWYTPLPPRILRKVFGAETLAVDFTVR